MTFLEKLDTLMKQKGLNKSTLSKQIDMPYTTIDGFYKKGYSNVKMSTICKLANYFNVTIDYLVDDEITEVIYRTAKPADSSVLPLTDIEEQLIIHFRQLSPTGKQYILQTMALAFQSYAGKNNAAPDVEAAQ